MDFRRGIGKREFPAVAFLAQWATGADVWPYFDGWCASRGVEHLALPWEQWLNLVYYFAVRNASTEDKEKFDNAITDRVTGWNLRKSKPAIDAVMAKSNDVQPDAEQARKRAPKPAWYGDDKSNTFNSKAAFATLTAPGVSGKKR